MKSTQIRTRLHTALLLLTAIVSQAQPNPEAVAFTKTYQDAYNKGDRPKLMILFADNVGWVNPDGSVTANTKADVDADFVRDFGESAGSHMDFAVVSTEAQPDGTMKIGTTVSGYDFTRKTGAKLNPTSGTYEMLIGKVGGQWKISQVKWAMNMVALELRDFVKAFQDAYNREDVAALKTMHTTNFVRTDGIDTQTGIGQITDLYAKNFANADVNTAILMANVAPQFDGSAIMTGSFHQNGRTTKGSRVTYDGAYTNTVVKENGQWKISRMVVSPIVKAVMHQKVADYPVFKKAIGSSANEWYLAGMVGVEMGTLENDPKTAYLITEWPSVAVAQTFFDGPILATVLKKAGVAGKPTVMILDKK